MRCMPLSSRRAERWSWTTSLTETNCGRLSLGWGEQGGKGVVNQCMPLLVNDARACAQRHRLTIYGNIVRTKLCTDMASIKRQDSGSRGEMQEVYGRAWLKTQGFRRTSWRRWWRVKIAKRLKRSVRGSGSKLAASSLGGAGCVLPRRGLPATATDMTTERWLTAEKIKVNTKRTCLPHSKCFEDWRRAGRGRTSWIWWVSLWKGRGEVRQKDNDFLWFTGKSGKRGKILEMRARCETKAYTHRKSRTSESGSSWAWGGGRYQEITLGSCFWPRSTEHRRVLVIASAATWECRIAAKELTATGVSWDAFSLPIFWLKLKDWLAKGGPFDRRYVEEHGGQFGPTGVWICAERLTVLFLQPQTLWPFGSMWLSTWTWKTLPHQRKLAEVFLTTPSRAHFLLALSTSWVPSEMVVPGYFCWREDVTGGIWAAVFESKILVLSLYALVSDQDTAFYEMVVGQIRPVTREACGVGAEPSFWTSRDQSAGEVGRLAWWGIGKLIWLGNYGSIRMPSRFWRFFHLRGMWETGRSGNSWTTLLLQGFSKFEAQIDNGCGWASLHPWEWHEREKKIRWRSRKGRSEVVWFCLRCITHHAWWKKWRGPGLIGKREEGPGWGLWKMLCVMKDPALSLPSVGRRYDGLHAGPMVLFITEARWDEGWGPECLTGGLGMFSGLLTSGCLIQGGTYCGRGSFFVRAQNVWLWDVHVKSPIQPMPPKHAGWKYKHKCRDTESSERDRKTWHILRGVPPRNPRRKCFGLKEGRKVVGAWGCQSVSRARNSQERFSLVWGRYRPSTKRSWRTQFVLKICGQDTGEKYDGEHGKSLEQ